MIRLTPEHTPAHADEYNAIKQYTLNIYGTLHVANKYPSMPILYKAFLIRYCTSGLIEHQIISDVCIFFFTTLQIWYISYTGYLSLSLCLVLKKVVCFFLQKVGIIFTLSYLECFF